jgi:hypothetical protein
VSYHLSLANEEEKVLEKVKKERSKQDLKTGEIYLKPN